MIVVISGPSNGGKSTIARVVAERAGWVHLEVDVIRYLIPSPVLRRANDHQQAMVQELVTAMAEVYTKHGFNVVFDEGVHDPVAFAGLLSRLRAVSEVVSIGLVCDFTLIVGARDKYAGSDYMPSRLRPNFDAVLTAIQQGLFNLTIDNSAQTPDQTAEQCLHFLRSRLATEVTGTPDGHRPVASE
jgi:predicted kinase